MTTDIPLKRPTKAIAFQRYGSPDFLELREVERPVAEDFAGQIEAIGKNVSPLKVGDKVFGFDDQGAGAHAQYLTISQDKVVAIPENTAYKQSAAIGSAAVQLLKYFDVDVTAVCATGNAGLIKSLGAARVIDYKKSDFTKGHL